MARKKSKEEWDTYANVFDQFTLRNLHNLENQGYFDGVVNSIKVGKEANIFLGKTSKDGTEKTIVVKIYRLENCNFNKMQQYIATDPRYPNIRPQKRDVVFAWVLREYRNLLVARQAGCRVPTPIISKANILLEEYIGGSEPAPQLKDVAFTSIKQVKECFEDVVQQLRILYHKAQMVHADISEFNILYFEDKPVLIDFSQGTSVKDFHAQEYLVRDVKNVVRFFNKMGLKLSENDVLKQITDKAL